MLFSELEDLKDILDTLIFEDEQTIFNVFYMSKSLSVRLTYCLRV